MNDENDKSRFCALPLERQVGHCSNCGKEFFQPMTKADDWGDCCDIFCNGASRLREGGWTITGAFECASPSVVMRMVRNVFDVHEFECGLKSLAAAKAERLSA